MVGKNWKIIEEYKDMLIYEKEGILHFGNKKFDSTRAVSIMSAKNRITRYINGLNKRQKFSLKFQKYNLKGVK